MKAELTGSTLEGFAGPTAPEAEESSGALAGTALSKAIKSGNGQAIYDAFVALQTEVDAELSAGEEEEPLVEDPTAA